MNILTSLITQIQCFEIFKNLIDQQYKEPSKPHTNNTHNYKEQKSL